MNQDTVKDVRDVKRKLSVQVDEEYGVRVFAIAASRNGDFNDDLTIPAISGDPICSEVYDIIRDRYYAYGVAYLDLGSIPISITMTMDDIYGWDVNVPLPSTVIRRYLDDEQKSRFHKWKQKFRAKDYIIKFMQVRNVY